SFTVVSDSVLTVVVPAWPTQLASATVADIAITNPAGTSAITSADKFTITPAGALPTIAALNVASGSTYGGQTVVITGSNFTDVAGIKCGSVAATKFTVLSPTSISVIAPAVPVGTVDITVTTTAGTSATTTADRFTFTLAAPTVTSLDTSSGFS